MTYISRHPEDFFDHQFHHGKPVPFMKLRHVLSAPFIWSGIILIPIADLWFEIYHRVAFPLYGIPYIDRSKYIRLDRHELSKLSMFEKINCLYCGYVNGWLSYAVAIAGETENYWCAIVHKKAHGYIEPEHHKKDKFESRQKYR